MNQFFKNRDNEEPKRVEAEIPVVAPEPVAEEPAPAPEPAPEPNGKVASWKDKSNNVI